MECKKVWLVNIGEPLPIEGNKPHRMSAWKNRLEKDGMEVDFFTTNFEHQKKRWLTLPNELNGFVLMRSGIAYKKNVSILRLLNHLIVGFSFFFTAFKRKRPDFIIVSYPTVFLAFMAVFYSRINGVKSIVDMRDKWPDIFISSPVLKLLLTPQFLMKRYIVSRASEVIGVSPGYVEWAGKYSNVSETHVLPLSHFSTVPNLSLAERDQFTLVFVGSLGSTYDLNLIIDLANILSAKSVNCKIVVCGDGPRKEEFLKNIEGMSHIHFKGWLNSEDLKREMSAANIGLMFYKADSPQGWPNKLLEYMAYGLPIINTLQGESWDLIERKKLGINVAPETLEICANWVESLMKDPQRYKSYVHNNLSTFSSEFDSDAVYNKLINLIG